MRTKVIKKKETDIEIDKCWEPFATTHQDILTCAQCDKACMALKTAPEPNSRIGINKQTLDPELRPPHTLARIILQIDKQTAEMPKMTNPNMTVVPVRLRKDDADYWRTARVGEDVCRYEECKKHLGHHLRRYRHDITDNWMCIACYFKYHALMYKLSMFNGNNTNLLHSSEVQYYVDLEGEYESAMMVGVGEGQMMHNKIYAGLAGPIPDFKWKNLKKRANKDVIEFYL